MIVICGIILVRTLMAFLYCPQKIFGAEVCAVPPRHLGVGDGDAGPGPGLPPELFHMHYVQ